MEPFLGIEPKRYDRRLCAALERVPLRVENNFTPHPQSSILGVLSKISDEHPPFLLYGSPLCPSMIFPNFKTARAAKNMKD